MDFRKSKTSGFGVKIFVSLAGALEITRTPTARMSSANAHACSPKKKMSVVVIVVLSISSLFNPSLAQGKENTFMCEGR